MSNVEINHAERGHSRFGASSSERWLNCTASVGLIESIERQQGKLDTSSEAAEEGTAAHELGEMCLRGGSDPIDHLGETINGFKVTQNMVDAVTIYVDYIRSFMESDSYTEGRMEILLENEFSLPSVDEECFGTGDCAVIEEFGVLTIVDYKHGQGTLVSPKENTQLMYYALGVLEDEDHKDKEFTHVDLAIVQPRAFDGDKPIKVWRTTVERIMEFKEYATKQIKEAKTEPKFMVTEKGCKWCPVKGNCPELRNKATEAAMLAFGGNLEVVPNKENMALKVDSIPVSEIPRLLEMEKPIKDFFSALFSRAEKLANNGVKIEGYKLIEKKGHRKMANEAEFVNEFEGIYGEDIYDKKLKSIAQLEKIVSKEDLAPYVFTPSNGTSLVKSSAKGKEIKPAVLTAFAEFTEEKEEENFDDI